MRVMVLGAGGMLGRDLVATAPPDFTLSPFTHVDLDITDTAALESRITDLQPDVIVNAAAYTAVDKAEAERDLAFRVNGEAVGVLGRLAAQAGSRVVHFSTDYVFDGNAAAPYAEEAPTRPINAYGASKLAGEIAVRDSRTDYLLIRTQWLFGTHGRSFPSMMCERAARRITTKVVSDQTGRPTCSHDLAGATWNLIRLDARGVFHVANAGRASWYDMAELIFQFCGSSDLLRKCSTVDYPTPARRPLFTVLDSAKFESIADRPLRPWRDALSEYLVSGGTKVLP